MSGRRRAALAAVVAAAFVCSACGADGTPTRSLGSGLPAPGAAATTIAPSPAPVAAVEADGKDARAVLAAPREEAAPTASVATDGVAPTPTPAAAGPDALAVTAAASQACVPVGGVIDVAISTAPGTTLGLAAMYADHDAHGAMGFGESDADGRYVWRLVIPADAPRGEAVAVIGADRLAEDGSRRSGHAVAPFTVAAIGSCG